MVISLFQTVRLPLSIFTVCKFVLSPIKYHYPIFIRCQLAKSNRRVSEIMSRTFARHEDVDDVTNSANVKLTFQAIFQVQTFSLHPILYPVNTMNIAKLTRND